METKNHHKITLQNTTLYQITCLAESLICLGMISEKDTGKKLPTYLSIIGLRKMTTVTAPYADICAPNDKRKIADWLKFLLRITCAPHSRDTDKKRRKRFPNCCSRFPPRWELWHSRDKLGSSMYILFLPSWHSPLPS